MISITAQDIGEATGGELLGAADGIEVDSVSTDTRAIADGCAFVALRGDRFDGNEFAADALAAGARIAVVERWEGEVPEGRVVIRVDDGLHALQRLARWHRMRLDLPVVGITGSNGKTSTKDFTRAVLSRELRVRATLGNLNNHIGVPLTVLSIDPEDGAAVVEMGMNHCGEIAPLCEIARPAMGIITNIGTAHIEFLGSREGIAEEKGALARSLPADGALFVPAGCDFFDYFRSRTKARVIAVGNGRGVVRAENLRQEIGGAVFTLVIEGRRTGEVHLPVGGRHMVKNALLAAGCGWFLGIDPEEIAAGLSATELTSGRLRRYLSRGVTVFDDTYNANPESMAAAIDTLAELPLASGAARHLVLGPMGELGEFAGEAHRRIGRLAADRGIDLIALGKGAEGFVEGAGGGEHFCDRHAAAESIAGRSSAGDLVLFKASRGARLEQVMNEAFPPDN